MSEEKTEEELRKEEEAHRFFLSEVLSQLLQQDRFQRFFRANYEVQQFINKEEKTIDIRVIERPPEVALAELQKAARDHAMEHMPLVERATLDDLAALEKQKK